MAALRRALVHHVALRRVADEQIVWHPGHTYVVQGYHEKGQGRVSDDFQLVLVDLYHAGLIGLGEPPEHLPAQGNPVSLTAKGEARLAEWNTTVGRAA